MTCTVLYKLRVWYWRRRYRRGRVVTSFLAPDIRCDVEVVDTSRIESGVITARTRTWNVLYASRGIKPEPAFGDAKETPIKELWEWSGARGGGAVSDSAEDGVGPADVGRRGDPPT
jgi:hypothetical protein